MVIKFDILNHADFCGEFRGDKYIPGLRKFHNAIETVREKNPDNTLLLDAGVEINRLLWHGRDVIDGMELIGTDAWTLGNHEFDRGRESLEENVEYIHKKIPVLCANIRNKNNGEPVKNTVPYVILERSGVKIGIIGVTTEYTEKMVTYPFFEPFETSSAADAVHRCFREVKEKGAQIIIVLAHIGAYSNDGIYGGELFELLENIRDLDIDLLIGGHTPGDICQTFDGIMVNKGGFSGKSLLHTTLYFDTEQNKVIKAEGEILYPLEEKYDVPCQKIDEFTEKVLKPFDLYFNDVFAVATEDVNMNYGRESAMGDLFADAVRWKTGTDFSYFNTTSCGPRIPEGNITRYSIKQAIYFDEHIHIAKFTGHQIRKLFETVHNPDIYSKNFNLYFSGLKVTIDHDREYGHKVVSIKHFDGRDVREDEVLSVATSAYMASGGNDTRKIAGEVNWKETDIFIHDAIKDYLTEKKSIDNSIDNRYVFLGRAVEYDDH